jgi:hypothetical protein
MKGEMGKVCSTHLKYKECVQKFVIKLEEIDGRILLEWILEK